jgi:glycosyltransferase involved in cell wall biosynthesis
MKTNPGQPIVIIPAFNPPSSLEKLVDELIERGVGHIVIVNDGSHAEKNILFASLEARAACYVLTHAVNLGKGRALKTAFNFVLTQWPNALSVVTADADSQHTPKDILNVIESSMAQPKVFHIGVRHFGKSVPFRSKFGNILTRQIFRLLMGIRISDTQSGLRGIPAHVLRELLLISGERYEFELAMLITLRRLRVRLLEVPIETVYLNNNSSSKFNPFIDSMKIYFVFFRFLFSSLTSALLDFVVFMAAFHVSDSVLLSLIISRFTASIINYFVNLRLVFKKHQNTLSTMVKYYLLVAFIMSLSYLMISLFKQNGLHIATAKILTETILFIVSFSLQRDFVFVNPVNDHDDGTN